MKKKSLRIVTCCMAGTLLFATPVYASPVAGVSLAVSEYLENDTVGQASGVGKVAAAKIRTASTSGSGQKNKKDKSKKEKEEQNDHKNMAVAQVDDYINIRKKPSEDGELLGKLYSNSVATVLKKKNGWYKITSGSVTGYVKGDYIVVGNEKLIKSVGTQVATVNTTTLKVRDKATKKSDVLTLVPDGEELAVTSMKDYNDGWVKVKIDGGNGYVSADYVEVSRQYTYAESKAEEEARIAAEQARIAAEEEQKRAEQEAASAADTASSTNSQASTGSSTSSQASTGSSTSSQAGTGSSTGSQASTVSNTDSQASTSSSSSAASSTADTSADSNSSANSSASASGQAVVNYATQFVGNPYVYGGSSLTNGTDCSGFVMSVYAHFGISLPHSSGALCSVGRGVSYADRQPGDIICYDGHVAIYVGNDTIVHASNPATGIKYTSPANYRTVVAVRRIF